MSGRTQLRRWLVVTAILATLPANAWAQDATQEAPDASEAPSTTGEIVVTAQRREQRLQDVPVSVAVTTGEEIANQGIRDLQDLAVRIPGVKLGTNTQSDTLAIRGIGSGLNAGFEQAVGTFVDGLYRGRSRATRAALFDIDRVEVLKGPQTTFFGNNTIAGALNITTRKPGRDFEYNAMALYAPADGEYIVEGGVSVPITDTLAVRGAVKFNGMNGYIYNRALDEDAPRLRDWVGRLSVRFEPIEGFRSDLRVDRARNRDKGQYTLEVINCPPPAPFTVAGSCALYLAQNGGTNPDNKLDYRADVGPSYFNLDMVEVAWNNEIDIGDHKLTLLTGYFNHDVDSFLQAQSIDVPGTGVGMPSRSPFLQIEKYESWSQEVRLESPTGGFLEYMLGAYYSHGDLDFSAWTHYFGTATGARGAPETDASTPIGQIRSTYQTDQTRSVFGSATLNLSQQLNVNLGLRYTSVLKKATRDTIIGISSATPGWDSITPVSPATEAALAAAVGLSSAQFAQPRTTYDRLLPAGSVQYKITPDVTAYASFAQGFKAGGYADNNGPVQFDSEFVDAYEIGVKGNLLDRTLFFGLAAFLSNYRDLQEAYSFISPTTGATVSTVANVAKARAKGVELNASWRPSQYLSFNGDMTWMDTKYLEYPGGPCTAEQSRVQGASCTQDLSGRDRVFSPKFSGTIGATGTIPFAGGDYELRVSPNLYYSSSYYLQPALDPLLKQSSYTKVDLRVAFGPEDQSWEAAIIGKNLTDAKFSTNGTVLGTSPGTVQILLDRARSVGFSFTIRG